MVTFRLRLTHRREWCAAPSGGQKLDIGSGCFVIVLTAKGERAPPFSPRQVVAGGRGD